MRAGRILFPGASEANESEVDWHSFGRVDSANENGSSQHIVLQHVAKSPSARAERTGFEPAVQYDPYADLANRCFRPLSHLSRLDGLSWVGG